MGGLTQNATFFKLQNEFSLCQDNRFHININFCKFGACPIFRIYNTEYVIKFLVTPVLLANIVFFSISLKAHEF